jgi:hypothetical protein
LTQDGSSARVIGHHHLSSRTSWFLLQHCEAIKTTLIQFVQTPAFPSSDPMTLWPRPSSASQRIYGSIDYIAMSVPRPLFFQAHNSITNTFMLKVPSLLLRRKWTQISARNMSDMRIEDSHDSKEISVSPITTNRNTHYSLDGATVPCRLRTLLRTASLVVRTTACRAFLEGGSGNGLRMPGPIPTSSSPVAVERRWLVRIPGPFFRWPLPCELSSRASLIHFSFFWYLACALVVVILIRWSRDASPRITSTARQPCWSQF